MSPSLRSAPINSRFTSPSAISRSTSRKLHAQNLPGIPPAREDPPLDLDTTRPPARLDEPQNQAFFLTGSCMSNRRSSRSTGSNETPDEGAHPAAAWPNLLPCGQAIVSELSLLSLPPDPSRISVTCVWPTSESNASLRSTTKRSRLSSKPGPVASIPKTRPRRKPTPKSASSCQVNARPEIRSIWRPHQSCSLALAAIHFQRATPA